MKTLAFSVSISLLIGLTSAALAAGQPALQRFGIEFGKPAPMDETITPYFLAENEFTFEFSPLDVDEALTTYLFHTTTTTNLVYKVEAFTRFNQFKMCEKERLNLNRRLSQHDRKKSGKSQFAANIFSRSEFIQDGQKISTTCVALLNESKLTVSFVDQLTEKRVLQEATTSLFPTMQP